MLNTTTKINKNMKETKRLKFMWVLMTLLVSGLFAASCSSENVGHEGQTELHFYAENISVKTAANEAGITTDSVFKALNQKLAGLDGWYADNDQTLSATKKLADEAVETFETADMKDVPFYGRFTVSYKSYVPVREVKLGEYSNKPLSKATLSTLLAQIAADNADGFTVDAVTLEPVTKGYAVSLAATQNSFGAEGLARVIDYVTAHSEVNAYGGWLNSDNNQYYYDATVICTTREEAEALARENNQIAYFDLENMEEIRL